MSGEYQNELYHHGIKGQKWGVRRYRNYDGSLTAAGKRRLNMDDNRRWISRTDAENRDIESKIHTQVSADFGQASKGANAAANASRSLSTILSKTSKMKKEKMVNKQKKISEMSNQELQAEINRMNLEKQYRNLKAEQISLGRDRASDYLNVAGDVLAAAASVATIAAAYHMYKR